MSLAADVEIRLRADIARLQQDMDAARRSVGGAMDSINRSVDAAKTAFAALAGVVSVGAFGSWIKGAIDATDALNDLSARSSISIEDLSGLSYAAKLADSNLDSIAGSITKLAQNMGANEDKFRRLGITATEPLEAFKQLSDIFKAIQDPQQRAAFGAEALGKSWQEAAVLLGEGSAGIDALIRKGQDLSGVTEETAAQAGKFNDKLDEVGAIAAGAGTRIAADLLPMLNLLVEDLQDAQNGASGLDSEFSPLKETFRALVILGGNVAFTFKAVGTEIGAIAAQIGMSGKAIGQAANRDFIGAAKTIQATFGDGGIGDMAKADAEKARKAFDEWQQGWLTVGTAAHKAREEFAVPFPDPFGIDGKFEEEARTRAAAFLRDSENSAKAKKAADEAAASAKRNAETYRSMIDALQMKVLETSREAEGLAKLTESQRTTLALDKQIRDGKLTMTVAERAQADALIRTLDANEKTIAANARQKAAADQVRAAIDELSASRQRELADANAEASGLEQQVATFGLAKSAIEQLEIVRLQEQLSQRYTNELNAEGVAQLEALIDAKKRSAGAALQLEGLEDAKKAGEELDKFLDSSKAQEFGDTLANAFGRAGSAMGKLSSVFQSYAAKQEKFEKQRGNAAKEYLNGLSTEEEYAKDLQTLDKQRVASQLGGYGDMAGAASGFFDEQSKGYKVLQGVSQAFHAAELAMTLAELVPKAISAVLGQGQGDPYTALPRMAAMAAFVATLGVAIGGGGGGGASVSVSKQRQAANGTGSVLGDSSAKSESIARAMDMVEDNTYRNLSVNYEMLSALRNIESSLTGLGSLIVRSAGLTGELAPDQMGSAEKFYNKVFAPGSLGEKLTGTMGKVIGKIFGGKVTTLDTGITAMGRLSDILAGGVGAVRYTDTKKDGGWFGSDKYRSQFESLGSEVNSQFTKVIFGLIDGVRASASVLGMSGDAFTNRLNSFVVDLGKISLTGLKGDEVQAALEAAFSKVGDDMAAFAVGGLSEFQQVGEGMFETLTRIANDYATIDAVLGSFGKSFGAFGLASVAARENLIMLTGGLEEFTSQGTFFMENFFSAAEKEASLRLAVYGQLDQVAGGSSVRSIAQFKNLVLAQDLTSQAGRNAYARLMSIQEAFIDLTRSTEETTAALRERIAAERDARRGIVDDMFAALQSAVNAEKGRAKTVFDALVSGFTTSITAASTKVSELQSLANALRGTTLPGTEMSRSLARAQIDTALAIARAGGVLPKAGDLSTALSVLSRDVSDSFGSFADYQREQLRTANSITELAGLTDTELTVAQQTLQTLNDQKAVAEKAYEAEVARLDAIVTNAQAQLDKLDGINTSVLSIGAALAALRTSIENVVAPPPVESQIAKLYETMLGRSGSAGEISDWKTAYGNGSTLDDIAAGFRESAEYQVRKLYETLLSRQADGAETSYWTNLLDQGASLEAVSAQFRNSAEYQALQRSSMYSGQQSATMDSSSAVAAAIDSLNARMAGMETAMNTTASSTQQMASQIDRVTAGGNAMLTEPA